MDPIRSATRLMGYTGLVLVPLAAWVGGWRAAIGLASGMGWALANVWVMAHLVTGSLGQPRTSRWRQAVWWVVKLPLLYVLGGWLLLAPWSSPVGFLVGFSVWFVMLVVGALRGAAT